MARYKTGTESRAAREARRERHAGETDQAVVINAAARFLELRSRSVDEVRRHLTKAAFPAELVDGAVERLLAIGLLDDHAYAQAWVESRDRSRPRGEGALRRELSLKGIDRETVAAILGDRAEAAEAAAEDGDTRNADETAAERLLHKNRAALLRITDPRARRSRAYALLARNGFDPEVCRELSARTASFDDAVDD
jgi:regulatory protein